MAEIVNMPKLGFDMAEGVLVRWVRSEGESVQKGEVLAEIETDKATVEVEASASGVVQKHIVQEGAIVPIGDPIAVIGEEGEAIDLEALVAAPASGTSGEKPEDQPAPSPREAQPETREREESGDGHLPGGVKASPLARRLALDLGVDLAAVQGSGPGGRIVKEDIRSASTARPARPAAPRTARGGLQTERLPMSKLRAAIGRRMTASKQQLPHFYVTIEVDAGPMMEMRKDYNEILPDEQRLSVNDFIIRAAALALSEYPSLNASLQADEIIRHGEVNIGVAVAVDEGLLTVVVRDAIQKPLPVISQEVRAMAARAREGKVQPLDIEGSTFTVSNLGMFDVDHFIAIINPPESAILAVGGVQEVPVVEGGKVVPGQRIKLTVSADHRVTDGAEAARWLQVVRSYLEQPLRLVV
jgi:pyruvate dehydrogenase E2 component (dihydrolipoamide acetyltransferase)